MVNRKIQTLVILGEKLKIFVLYLMSIITDRPITMYTEISGQMVKSFLTGQTTLALHPNTDSRQDPYTITSIWFTYNDNF